MLEIVLYYKSMKLVFFCLLLVSLSCSLHIQIEASIPLALNDNNVYIPLGYEAN